MEAQGAGAFRPRAAGMLVFAWLILIFASRSYGGAGFRTSNFVIDAPTPALAQEIGHKGQRV